MIEALSIEALSSLFPPVHPALPLLVGGLLAAVARGRLLPVVAVAAPAFGLLNAVQLSAGDGATWTLAGYQLEILRADKLSLLFGYLFHLAALLAAIYSLHVRDRVQQVTGLLYAGSAIGAVFAGDLVVLFVFWELLAVTSVFQIWARRTPESLRAGQRYLLVHVSSGLLLMAGATLRLHETGSLRFERMELDGVASLLILVAFGIKCAFPLVHTWLTDAYPEGTVTGSVFLATFSTKTAVYALARGFAGTEQLIWIGAIMTAFPIFYAVIENDLRRVLSYSLINQLGFMVVGVGIGTELALNGTVSHAFAHVLYKGLLFMSMGAVLLRTGRIEGSELGGLYKTMPWTAAFCMIGAASISAFPLFSGFVSKSMILSAAAHEGQVVVWLTLLFASAGVFHHSGIKIPFFAFYAHDSGLRPKEAPPNMLIAMGASAALCIAIGCLPAALYRLLPYEVLYQPYTASHVLEQVQLLFFSALAFTWLNLAGIYPPELRSVNLDADWVPRRLVPAALGPPLRGLAAAWRIAIGGVRSGIEALVRRAKWMHSPTGRFGEPWQAGETAFWAALLFAALVLFAFWERGA
ncbi:MAG TPA: Na(+)/H(+) antiporter subunit D [Thermoanaerobaculia bacterium]|nr:Na(+)/H(+) antiporter subunit D [Thermoanaerobaculia bacterium]